LLKAIGKLIAAFNGNTKKAQIAAGVSWGILLGLIPAGNFFFIVLFLISFCFRHHHWSKIFGLTIVKLLSPLIIMTLDSLGWFILTGIEPLQPFFTSLYNMPFVPFTKFNNTLVAGGLAAGIVLWLPFFFIFLGIITLYRNIIADKIRNSKFIKKLADSPVFTVIDKVLFK